MAQHQSYFEIFNLPMQFDMDMTALETQYLSLQNQLHPDRFATKSGAEKLAAGSRAADINEAYHTLKDPLRRANHLLALSGVDFDIAKERTIHDPELLTEMLERREELDDATDPKIIAGLGQIVDRDIITGYRKLADGLAAQNWDGSKIIMLRLQYLRKFQDDVRQKQMGLLDA